MKSRFLLLIILIISNPIYSQKNDFKKTDHKTFSYKLEGTWRQIQDTNVILIIRHRNWTFVTKDRNGKDTRAKYKVNYENSISIEGQLFKGIAVATLKNQSALIKFEIDAIKGSESIYMTNMESMESFGYLRKTFPEIE